MRIVRIGFLVSAGIALGVLVYETDVTNMALLCGILGFNLGFLAGDYLGGKQA